MEAEHSHDQGEDCVICCLELTGKDQTTTECCSNDLHIACLFQWLLSGQGQTCPFCRHIFSEGYRKILKGKNLIILANNNHSVLPSRVIVVGLFDGERYPLGLIAQSPFRNTTRYILVSGDHSLQFKVIGAKYSYFEPKLSKYMVESAPQIGTFMLELSQADNQAIVALQNQLETVINQTVIPGINYQQRSNQHLNLQKVTVSDHRPYLSVKEAYQGHYENEIRREFEPDKILHRGMGDFVFHIRVLKTPYGIFVTPCAISAQLKPILKSQFTPIGSGKCFL
jgi:hypothetical protein